MSNFNAKKVKLIKPVEFKSIYLIIKLLGEEKNCPFLSEENKNLVINNCSLRKIAWICQG
jgi:hypothetical protein